MENIELEISLFDFSDYKAFLLKKGLPHGHYSHGHKNLNNWAKRLGYKSASSLSMILSGERFPSEQMIEKISSDLKLTPRERRYFKLLVELEKKKSKNKSHEKILEDIKKFNAERNSYPIDAQEFSTISEWHYLAIKQLISTPSFIEDEQWIYKRLRKKISVGQIKKALQDLEQLGIIKRDINHKLNVIKPGLMTSNDIPSSAIKKHHYGMIELAQMAITEQDVNERQINSTTLKVNKNDLPEAKKFIFDFIKEFATRFNQTESDEIYQLNVQLFALTNDLKH